MKDRYTLYIDERLVWTSNHVPVLKEKAQFEFDYLNAFFAKILVYNKVYSTRFYNTKWTR